MSALQAHGAAGLGQALPAVLLVLLLPEREQAAAPLLLVPPLLPPVLLGESRTEQVPV